MHTQPVSDLEKIYRDTRNHFEDFSIHFIKNMLDEIKQKNKEYQVLSVFHNHQLLEKVIKHGVIKAAPKLTERERECIKLIKNNYPPKLIARTMDISEKTVRHYIEAIKEKLQSTSLQDIYEKAMQYDL